MASYVGAIRTNYFRVTEEEKFRNLIDEFLSGSCEVLQELMLIATNLLVSAVMRILTGPKMKQGLFQDCRNVWQRMILS